MFVRVVYCLGVVNCPVVVCFLVVVLYITTQLFVVCICYLQHTYFPQPHTPNHTHPSTHPHTPIHTTPHTHPHNPTHPSTQPHTAQLQYQAHYRVSTWGISLTHQWRHSMVCLEHSIQTQGMVGSSGWHCLHGHSCYRCVFGVCVCAVCVCVLCEKIQHEETNIQKKTKYSQHPISPPTPRRLHPAAFRAPPTPPPQNRLRNLWHLKYLTAAKSPCWSPPAL